MIHLFFGLLCILLVCIFWRIFLPVGILALLGFLLLLAISYLAQNDWRALRSEPAPAAVSALEPSYDSPNYQSGTAHDSYAQECYIEGVRGDHDIEVCVMRKQAAE
ncbi:hypothetical protein [Cupriavidus sp. BIS7]|uniref:hypothetical protein n=1 Tax=Cupriavidus sp. BIS7 TaxID=1217718 RepID=UPI00056955FD|nr:hypothetical protein [Cupriavidus sp. BIS7]